MLLGVCLHLAQHQVLNSNYMKIDKTYLHSHLVLERMNGTIAVAIDVPVSDEVWNLVGGRSSRY